MKKIFLSVMVILSLNLAQNLSNLSTNSSENSTNSKTNPKNQVFALMKYDKNLLENGLKKECEFLKTISILQACNSHIAD